MKRLSVILMACLLVLGMSQCKKEKPIDNNEGEKVNITLKLSNGGEKVTINPDDATSTASVAYNVNDIIYVGYNNKYIGYLTCASASTSGSTFTGDISTLDAEGQYLQFILMGGQDVTGDLTVGSNASYIFSLADQSSAPAVVSCGASKETYSSSRTSYSADLKNQCALVKFTLSESTNAAITISGVYNTVTIDFNGTVTPGTTPGDIVTYGTGSVRYAVLPVGQDEVSDGTLSATGYTGTFSIPAETSANAYLTGATMTLTASGGVTPTPPTPAANAFTVNADGKQVYFAPGNLQYNDGTWSFAPNQYDYLGTWTDGGLIDLFSFGSWTTTGGANPYNYQSLGTNESDFTMTKNDLNGTIEGYTNVNWYTLSQDEWIYVINSDNLSQYRHVTVGGVQKAPYGQANVMGINGLIILPDGWDGSVAPNFVYGETDWADNTFDNSTNPSWSDLESAGVVFLPAAGFRIAGTDQIMYFGGFGFYRSSTPCDWSSTATPPLDEMYGDASGYSAYFLLIHRDSSIGAPYVKTIDCFDWRSHGASVRLVRDAN